MPLSLPQLFISRARARALYPLGPETRERASGRACGTVSRRLSLGRSSRPGAAGGSVAVSSSTRQRPSEKGYQHTYCTSCEPASRAANRSGPKERRAGLGDVVWTTWAGGCREACLRCGGGIVWVFRGNERTGLSKVRLESWFVPFRCGWRSVHPMFASWLR